MTHPESAMTAARLAELRADYEAGASALSALAARFSLSPTALRMLARRLDFAPRPPIAPFQRRGAPPAATPPPPAGRPRKASPAKPAPAKAAARKSARKAAPRGGDGAAEAPPGAAPASLKPLDMQAMADRLRHAAERELVKINDRLEAGADVERQARVLASLVKTLGDLARLGEARAAARDDDRPWTLDDLNAEIERQIGFLSQSEPSVSPSGSAA